MPGRPDDRHLHLIQHVPFRPFFIIGDHRSGTTLLHRLLAETGCFNYVSAYHVIRYDEVLTHHVERTAESETAALMRLFEQLGVKNRVIDDVPATPDAPVEYGFILAAALNIRRAFLTPTSHATFLELCRKVQYVSDPARPLLLKNPWDVLNFMTIRSLVPDARFIFIHRHPLDVMTSQVRAIRSLLAARNPFVAMLAPWYARLHERPLQLRTVRWLDSWFQLWVRLVGLHTIRASTYFLDNVGSLPASEYVSLRYEDLCREPDSAMHRILQFAGVVPAQTLSWSDRIQPRSSKVPPDVARSYRRLLDRLRPYLEFHGYEAEPARGLTTPSGS
jgi:hypothetical protein